MILLLIFFIVLLGINLMSRSISILFIVLQIISLIGVFFIGVNYEIVSLTSALNLVFTAFILFLVIMPWMKINNIKEISFWDERKMRRLTRFLLIISIIPFITFLVVSTFVFLYVEDIDAFKYADDVSTDFYYSLPVNTKILIISSFLYYFSYFLIPLHFFYLSKRNFKLSIWCFIFSLNIIFFGLTFFSRSVIVHYLLLYLAFLFLLYNTFDRKIRRVINVTIIVAGVIFTSYFIYITNTRFAANTSYSELVPEKAIIQDPVTYSYFDYLSQWYGNNMYVLDHYNNQTFGGQITFQSILSLMGQYGVINYSPGEYANLRQKLWPQNWYSFNGFVAYSVYDYGYILTVLFGLIYFVVVIRLRPRKNSIPVINLFYLVLLIQIPLVAIFYSAAGGIILPALLLIPIYLYLKIKWT